MSVSETLAALWTWTPFLGGGFLWNIAISIAAMAIGTPLGYLLARMRLSGSRLGAGLTAAARVPPTFVLIYYLAYILPPEIAIGPLAFAVPAWFKASLALSVAVAGFVSDNALAALGHHRQGDHAEALYFLPAWTTYFLIIVMASSTASVIGVPEIVQRANTVIAAIGEPEAILWVYLYAMAWFLAFCWPLARLMGYAKVRLSRSAGSHAGSRMIPAEAAAAEASLLVLTDGVSAVDAGAILDERFDVPPAAESVATIQARFEASCEGLLDPAALFKLSLAVEELVTNIVKYGNAGSEPIHVEIRHDPRHVALELSFAGDEFDPFRDAPQPRLDASVEDRPIGGLGIHLVTQMVDQAFYHRRGERNEIRLVMLRGDASAGEIAP